MPDLRGATEGHRPMSNDPKAPESSFRNFSLTIHIQFKFPLQPLAFGNCLSRNDHRVETTGPGEQSRADAEEVACRVSLG
jgi:hypothetical protein